MKELACYEVSTMPAEVQEFIQKQEAHENGQSLSVLQRFEPTAFYSYHTMQLDDQEARAELYLAPPAAFQWFAGLDDFLEKYFPRLPAGLRQQLNFLVNHEVCNSQGRARYLVRSLPFEALWGVLRVNGLVEQRMAPSLVKPNLAVKGIVADCYQPDTPCNTLARDTGLFVERE